MRRTSALWLVTVVACGASGTRGADVPDATEVVDISPPDTAEPADVPIEATEAVDAAEVFAAEAEVAEMTADSADVVEVVDASPALPLTPPGPGFHVSGTAVVDDQGRTLLMHGCDVSNYAKYSPDLLTWEQPADFAALADLGFGTIRLLTFWAAIMPEEGKVDTAYVDAFVERIDWAAAAGLTVIVDMHQDIFGVGFGDNGAPRWACDESLYASYKPSEPWYVNYTAPEVKACFQRFYHDDKLFGEFQDAWVALATRLADHPAVVGFDLLNEPNPSGDDAAKWVRDVWQPREEQLAKAIHAVAPHRVVFFQGATLANIGMDDPFVPSPDPAVAYAPHYYHPLVHDGGAYDHDSMAPMIDASVDAIAMSAAALGGRPVWMGEFGGPTDVPNFDSYLEDMLTRFESHAWGWAFYGDDKGDSFSFREADGSLREHVVARLAHPYARRVPGTVVGAASDFASQAFETRFRWEYDAPVEAWTGRGGLPGNVVVAPADDPTATVPCVAAAGAAAGVVECTPAPGTTRYGAEYLVSFAQP